MFSFRPVGRSGDCVPQQCSDFKSLAWIYELPALLVLKLFGFKSPVVVLALHLSPCLLRDTVPRSVLVHPRISGNFPIHMTGLLAAAPAGIQGNPAIILAIFVITYLGIAMGRFPGLKLNRTGITLLGAIAVLTFGGLTTGDAIAFINWPTILLLFGFFVISAQLRLSGFYDRVAGGISARLEHPAWFMLVLMAVAGGLSAVLNNDIVAYAFTPIVGSALMRQRLNPIPFLIALAISTNIGAAATLIGNAQGIMIGQVAHLSFASYLLWAAVPVVAAMAAAFGIIWWLSRKKVDQALLARASSDFKDESYPYDRSHTIKGLVILVIVIGMFFTSVPKEITALVAAGIHLASPKFRTEDLFRHVDWSILVLFMGLFVVTGAFQSAGYGTQVAQWLTHAHFNLNSPYTLALTTAGLSNLIGNSGTVMLLLKIIDLGHPTTMYVLAAANSFGGNLLLIGSLANIIVVQQARTLGIRIGFVEFARLGVPVTVAAFAVLLLWIWLLSLMN